MAAHFKGDYVDLTVIYGKFFPCTDGIADFMYKYEPLFLAEVPRWGALASSKRRKGEVSSGGSRQSSHQNPEVRDSDDTDDDDGTNNDRPSQSKRLRGRGRSPINAARQSGSRSDTSPATGVKAEPEDERQHHPSVVAHPLAVAAMDLDSEVEEELGKSPDPSDPDAPGTTEVKDEPNGTPVPALQEAPQHDAPSAHDARAAPMVAFHAPEAPPHPKEQREEAQPIVNAELQAVQELQTARTEIRRLTAENERLAARAVVHAEELQAAREDVGQMSAENGRLTARIADLERRLVEHSERALRIIERSQLNQQ